MTATREDLEFYQVALESARVGLAEGGIPIGAALVIDGQLRATGRNQRVQRGSAIHHGETNCIENAGRLAASEYRRATLYTTLSPCDMCAGTVLLYGIARVVVGERSSFTAGNEEFLRGRGVQVVVLDDAETQAMMQAFIRANPKLWNEDIGEEDDDKAQ